MKVLLHSDYLQSIEKSGVGRAIKHQMKALELNDVAFTTDQNEDYDIVHINTIFPQSYLLSKKAKRQGKKVVYHAHSTEEDFRNSFLFSNAVSGLFKKWITKCYDSADLILTPTPYAKRLLSHYNLHKPVEAVSNGIDLNFFQREPGDREAFRRKFHFAKTDKVIIAVGLYIERKGILDFVELAKMLPQYHFVWFGYTNLKTVPKKIREAVETKLPNLHFPGYVPREELKQAYSGCDLFFFPTYEETEGIVVLEALAMKTPVLLRDIPIYEEWLVEDTHVYKGKKLADFRDKMIAMVEGKVPLLVEKGYQVAQQRDLKIIGTQLKECYKTLCN